MEGPESQNCSEMTSDVPRSLPTPATLNTPPPSNTPSMSNHFSVRAPEPRPAVALQMSTEQLQPNPLGTLDVASHLRFDVPPPLEDPQLHWRVVAPEPHELPLFPSTSPPSAASMPSSGHESGFPPYFTWACPVPPHNPIASDISPNYQTLDPNLGATCSNLSHSGTVRPDKHCNRLTDRHQRLTRSRPYAILNHADTPVNCADLPTQLPPREAARVLGPTNADGRLTLATYEWLFAVMYPKRRPDKKKPTPSGRCQLCESTCKRPGILQQHLTILHRQRIARKHLAGKPYDLQLALAFVVAQVLCDVVMNSQMDAVHRESQAFLVMLENNSTDLESLQPGAFPSLHQKLDEFSRLESWVGVRCQNCGMWATRPIALEEHAAICSGSRRLEDSSGLKNVFQEPFRLTASGLAARPNRDAILDQ